jgi:hypothetical protein
MFVIIALFSSGCGSVISRRHEYFNPFPDPIVIPHLHKNKKRLNMMLSFSCVMWGGIEPATQGFSVLENLVLNVNT